MKEPKIDQQSYSVIRVTARSALEPVRDVYAVSDNPTNKVPWGPNTLIKQGAALVATWEDVWKAPLADIRLAFPLLEQPASSEPGTASFFGGPNFVLDEQKIFAVLRAAEPTHSDELVETLVAELSSSQIFAALFARVLSGRIRCSRGNISKSHLAATSVISELRGSRASVVSVSTEIIIVVEQR